MFYVFFLLPLRILNKPNLIFATAECYESNAHSGFIYPVILYADYQF